MSRRTPQTLADYLAVAVCPALIMLLVGSLVFFLIEVFYQGQYGERLLFVMAMFVMAIVAIARISIEQDVGFATLYAIPLAGVVLFAMSHFSRIEGPLASVSMLVNACFMAIVWWSAHKLTWDCTLIDDTQDASGKGLLQEMGLDLAGDAQAANSANQAADPAVSTRPADANAVTHDETEPQRSWIERWLASDKRPHAPGVWIVYFSLAALPLFGFGGWFVRGDDAAARGRVFQLLVVYVASGLALLLATSFLGLRRYLRQRKLEMPLEMTAAWAVLGVAIIFATLIVAAILPRPRAEFALTQLPVVVTSAVRRASRLAVGKKGTEDQSNEHAAKGEAQEEQQAGNDGTTATGKSEQPRKSGGSGKSGESGSAEGRSESNAGSGEGKSQGKRAGSDTPGGKGAKGQKSGETEGRKGGESGTERRDQLQGDSQNDSSPGERQDQRPKEGSSELAKSETPPQEQPETASQTSQSPSQLASNVMRGLGTLFRWLCYLALFIAAIVLGWIYRAELLAAWTKLLTELRDLWGQWFGGKTTAEAAAANAQPAAPPPRPFASFDDPFASGEARGMSWPELVRYTFAAAEAWGREHNAPRQADQTPHEFALALAQVEPQVGRPAQVLAAWYSQLAYAPRSAAPGSAAALQQLWQALRAAPVPPPLVTPRG